MDVPWYGQADDDLGALNATRLAVYALGTTL
jgi:hypothetical protein